MDEDRELTEDAELICLQEALFNTGCTFHSAQLLFLAARNYEEALRLADAHPRLFKDEAIPSLTRPAAHNLVLIYQHSRSDDMALSVMEKYLRV